MRKFLLSVTVAIFVFSASLVSAAQVMVKDFQAEKGTVSVWKIAKALNHPGWDGVNALRKSDPNLPPLKKVGKIWDIKIYPNTVITLPEGWHYEGIDQTVVEPFPATPSLSHSLAAEGFNSPKGTITYESGINQKNDMWDFWISTTIALALLTLVLGILIASIISFNKRRRMPSRAIIPGGITPNRPQEVEDRFNRIAERHYGEANPQADLSVERPVRIGPIEAGFLNGHGTVEYRDKPRKEKMRNEPVSARATASPMEAKKNCCLNRRAEMTFTPARGIADLLLPRAA